MSELGEFQLIERFFRRKARTAVVGIGDDAAVLAPTAGHEVAISVDMLVEGRHFSAGVDPESLGHKSLAVNLSDMAAVGATPRWALLAGALPTADAAWLAAFARGMFALADKHSVELVGGDTTRGPLTLCVTIVGEVPFGKALLRSGARDGDSIWVSGRLGDAALALAHLHDRVVLSAEELAGCERALLWPAPRVELGMRLRGIATAAIDLSDGLTGDLGHVLAASGVGARLDLVAIPRGAALDRLLKGDTPLRDVALRALLAGGDDYELCFTAPRARDADVEALGRDMRIVLSRIGRITTAGELTIHDRGGNALDALPPAFDHFAS
ncbi:MAG: thiamine-phosphate kinase [Betaproteobacteria bacterium]